MTFSEIGSALLPWKEAITGVVGILSGIAAIGLGIWKQRRKPDTSYTEPPAPPPPRGQLGRMHPDDREAIADLREDVTDLSRALRHAGRILEENTVAVDKLRGAL